MAEESMTLPQLRKALTQAGVAAKETVGQSRERLVDMLRSTRTQTSRGRSAGSRSPSVRSRSASAAPEEEEEAPRVVSRGRTASRSSSPVRASVSRSASASRSASPARSRSQSASVRSASKSPARSRSTSATRAKTPSKKAAAPKLSDAQKARVKEEVKSLKAQALKNDELKELLKKKGVKPIPHVKEQLIKALAHSNLGLEQPKFRKSTAGKRRGTGGKRGRPKSSGKRGRPKSTGKRGRPKSTSTKSGRKTPSKPRKVPEVKLGGLSKYGVTSTTRRKTTRRSVSPSAIREERWEDLTKDQLKAELSKRGLQTSGNKPVLIERLRSGGDGKGTRKSSSKSSSSTRSTRSTRSTK